MYIRTYHRTRREAFGPAANIDLCHPAPYWTPIKVALCVVYAASIVTLFFVL